MANCERCQVGLKEINLSPKKIELCPICGGGPGALDVLDLRKKAKEENDIGAKELLNKIDRELEKRTKF